MSACVRMATEQDAKVLMRLVHDAFSEYLGKLDPPSGAHKETAESIRQHLREAYGAVAVLDEEPVGCVLFKQEKDHVYLGRLAVVPRVRSLGIGGQLMSFVEDFAKTTDTPRVRLGTRLCLTHLIAFYEKRGYRVIEKTAHEGYSTPTAVVLELELSR